MVVDSSVLVAMVLDEPEAPEFAYKLGEASILRVSVVSLTEASIVLLSRGGQRSVDALDILIAQLNIIVMPVDRLQAEYAREAFAEYGKGRHRAGLNLGDCFVYSLTKLVDEPLLFKGADFSKTDLAFA